MRPRPGPRPELARGGEGGVLSLLEELRDVELLLEVLVGQRATARDRARDGGQGRHRDTPAVTGGGGGAAPRPPRRYGRGRGGPARPPAPTSGRDRWRRAGRPAAPAGRAAPPPRTTRRARRRGAGAARRTPRGYRRRLRPARPPCVCWAGRRRSRRR